MITFSQPPYAPAQGRPAFGIDASDLGWTPGEWPRGFTHEGRHYEARRVNRDDDHDIMWVDYLDRQNLSVLRVFSD